VNTVTGQFSCGAAGLMIRDGELAEPVRETTVAATLPVILDGIVAIADDLRILPGGAMIPNRGGEPGTGNSVIAPAVVIRPMFPPNSVNHRSPPGPVVISMGQLPGVPASGSGSATPPDLVGRSGPGRSARCCWWRHTR